MRDDPIIQEIDDHIEKNNLDPLDKLILRVMKYNYANGLQIKEDVESIDICVKEHHDDKDLHSPRGILLNANVIGWAIFIMILISTIVTYLPEKLGVLSPP